MECAVFERDTPRACCAMDLAELVTLSEADVLKISAYSLHSGT